MGSGETLLRRYYNSNFDASSFFARANLIEGDLDLLLQGIPYLTDEQLVELFQQLRDVTRRTWKAQAAILWEAKKRSVYGDRAWEAMGRTFGLGWRQAYNLARVWETFFKDDSNEFCIRMQNCALEEVTWYVVATETQSPEFWLHYAEDQKAFAPSYSIADFREDIRLAGARQEPGAIGGEDARQRCQWLRVYCQKLDRIVRPGECPGCDVLPLIQEALR